MNDRYLTYRGQVRALAPIPSGVAFVTAHAEGQPTAFYRLELGKTPTLTAEGFPGGTALIASGEMLYAAGTDNRLYVAPLAAGAPKSLGVALPVAVTALAALSDDRLAALAGPQVFVIATADGSVRQTLDLPENGTALASDPTGTFFAVGTETGNVSVFDGEMGPTFVVSDTTRLHEGAVTALIFEADEMRFFSTGADLKLLSTHARGKLDPEDKGRTYNHTEPIAALAFLTPERLLTAGGDKVIKNWPRAGYVRPASTEEEVPKVTALVVTTAGKRTRVIALSPTNRLFEYSVNDEVRIEALVNRFHDAYAAARQDIEHHIAKTRTAGLQTLAGYDDEQALNLLARVAQNDHDRAVCLEAVEWLGKSAHPQAVKHLENILKHFEGKVRRAAFAGLRQRAGTVALRPLILALKTKHADLGMLAVAALETLAKTDDQAHARLTATLDASATEVRVAALTALERLGGKTPDGDLAGLGSKHADLRRLALVRLFQRQLLLPPTVQTAVRRRLEDDDGEVRRVAFLVSVLGHETLAAELRSRDKDIHRQLLELEKIEAPTKGEMRKGKGE